MSDQNEELVRLQHHLAVVTRENNLIRADLAQLRAEEKAWAAALGAAREEAERLRKELSEALEDNAIDARRDAAEAKAVQEGSNAIMKEALGPIYGQLWGPPLESLGRMIDAVQFERDTALQRAEKAEASAGALRLGVAEMLVDADNACNPHSDECETERDEGCSCWVGRARSALSSDAGKALLEERDAYREGWLAQEAFDGDASPETQKAVCRRIVAARTRIAALAKGREGGNG
jgi:hypothetical protein